MSRTIYYAHSLHIYNTPQEERDIKLLADLGFEVVNPNNPKTQEEYNEWCKTVEDAARMKFFDWMVGKCLFLAFRRHIDGKIPSGVMYEIEYAEMRGIPVFELPTILPSHKLTVEETRAYLKYNGQR